MGSKNFKKSVRQDVNIREGEQKEKFLEGIS